MWRTHSCVPCRDSSRHKTGVASARRSAYATFLLLSAPALAQDRTLQIPRLLHPPTLEDFSGMTAVTDFRQRQPADGAPVSRKTTAWLGYDDRNVYAIFVCEADRGKLRARLNKREDIFNDEVVGLFLDTFRDRQHSFEFLVNPLGVQADGISTEGQGDDFTFDTLWRSEGHLTREGYTVLIAIPFRSLRFKNRDVQTWGVALVRLIPENNETSFWPFVTQKVEGFAQQLATLEGIRDVSPSRNLQFIPYGLFSRSRFLDAGIPAFRRDTTFRGGLDSKIVLRDALTLDIALNPDFSQVESDDPQVTINQRFEVFFPEKRPFFIENAGYFQTPENLFFSRRIVDPEFGARLTGKIGRWALGALAIDDRAPGNAQVVNQGDRAAIGVVRAQREFGKQSTIGVLATSRDIGSSSNRVISLDARVKLNANWIFTAQAVHSESRDPDGGHPVGSLYYAEIAQSGLHFNYSGRYRDRSPNFRSDLGFIPRVDIRQTEQNLNYRWKPAGNVVVSHGPVVSALGNWDHRGRTEDWNVSPGYFIELKRQTYISLNRTEAFERFMDRKFRKNSSDIFIGSDYFEKVRRSGLVLYRGTRELHAQPERSAVSRPGHGGERAPRLEALGAVEARGELFLYAPDLERRAPCCFQ